MTTSSHCVPVCDTSDVAKARTKRRTKPTNSSVRCTRFSPTQSAADLCLLLRFSIGAASTVVVFRGRTRDGSALYPNSAAAGGHRPPASFPRNTVFILCGWVGVWGGLAGFIIIALPALDSSPVSVSSHTARLSLLPTSITLSHLIRRDARLIPTQPRLYCAHGTELISSAIHPVRCLLFGFSGWRHIFPQMMCLKNPHVRTKFDDLSAREPFARF